MRVIFCAAIFALTLTSAVFSQSTPKRTVDFLMTSPEHQPQLTLISIKAGEVINLHILKDVHYVIEEDFERKENVVKLMGEPKEGLVVTVANKDKNKVLIGGIAIQSGQALQLLYLFGQWHVAQPDPMGKGWIIAELDRKGNVVASSKL